MNALKAELIAADYKWILFSVPIAMASHYFRGLRWNMLLEVTGYRPKASRTFAALLVGYMVNQAIPRGGEIARCSMMLRTEKVPLSVSMGTVLIERVFDVIVLLGFVGLFLFLESGRLLHFFSDSLKSMNIHVEGMGMIVAVSIVTILISTVLFLYFFWARLKTEPFFARFADFGTQMLGGVKSIFKLKNPLLFLAYTAGIWLCYTFMTWLPFYCLPASSSFGLYFAFILMTMGGIGMAMPSPGGIGPYHAAVKFTVVAFFADSLGQNTSENLGLTLATLMHTSQLIMLIIAGFFAWLAITFIAPRDSAIDKKPVELEIK